MKKPSTKNCTMLVKDYIAELESKIEQLSIFKDGVNVSNVYQQNLYCKNYLRSDYPVTYKLDNDNTITISLKGDHLWVNSGLGKYLTIKPCACNSINLSID